MVGGMRARLLDCRPVSEADSFQHTSSATCLHHFSIVVVVVDDSHIQRIVLATEETTVTQQ